MSEYKMPAGATLSKIDKVVTIHIHKKDPEDYSKLIPGSLITHVGILHYYSFVGKSFYFRLQGEKLIDVDLSKEFIDIL